MRQLSLEKARAYLKEKGYEDRIILTEESSATVELAAKAVGAEPAEIAKTMSFLVGDQAILILIEGTARIDNPKFKAAFHTKAKMIPADEVESRVGHAPGGVCPFGVDVPVYLDVSLKKHAIVYPAAGNDHSAVRMTPAELEECLHAAWVDISREQSGT